VSLLIHRATNWRQFKRFRLFERDCKLLLLSFCQELDFQASSDVRAALPEAILIEAAPDYVGLSDVADSVGVTRQNLRKLML
jgi:hypothetical protein